MTLSADYAMSRYGGIAYGMRGAAGYIVSTGDGVAGGDAISAIAGFNALTSDVSAGGDNVVIIAAFITSTADGVLGNDVAGVGNNIAIICSEAASSADTSSAVTQFYILYREQIDGLDAILASLFLPINVFVLEQEKRNARLFVEMRAGIAPVRLPGQAMFENRQVATKTDTRNAGLKSDSRSFEA